MGQETDLTVLIGSLVGGGGAFGTIVGFFIKKAFAMYSKKISDMSEMLTNVNTKIAVNEEQNKRFNEIIADFKETTAGLKSDIMGFKKDFYENHSKLSDQFIKAREEMALMNQKMQAAFKLIDDHSKRIEKLDDRIDSLTAGGLKK